MKDKLNLNYKFKGKLKLTFKNVVTGEIRTDEYANRIEDNLLSALKRSIARTMSFTLPTPSHNGGAADAWTQAIRYIALTHKPELQPNQPAFYDGTFDDVIGLVDKNTQTLGAEPYWGYLDVDNSRGSLTEVKETVVFGTDKGNGTFNTIVHQQLSPSQTDAQFGWSLNTVEIGADKQIVETAGLVFSIFNNVMYSFKDVSTLNLTNLADGTTSEFTLGISLPLGFEPVTMAVGGDPNGVIYYCFWDTDNSPYLRVLAYDTVGDSWTESTRADISGVTRIFQADSNYVYVFTYSGTARYIRRLELANLANEAIITLDDSVETNFAYNWALIGDKLYYTHTNHVIENVPAGFAMTDVIPTQHDRDYDNSFIYVDSVTGKVYQSYTFQYALSGITNPASVNASNTVLCELPLLNGDAPYKMHQMITWQGADNTKTDQEILILEYYIYYDNF